MNYEDALRFILGFSDYERRTQADWNPADFSLARVERFCQLLGDPHRAFASIHIAGTKGKGSTAAMLHAALAETGLRPGLFTSPHLHCFRERIRLGHEMIAEEELAEVTAAAAPQVARLHELHPELGRLTTFEVLTGVAFLYFARAGAPLVVVETGLGGRLDATNVVTPLVAVLTPISLDHTQVLGNTVEAIAREKAGIIKEHATVISALQPPAALAVLEETCATRGAELRLEDRDWHWWEEVGGDRGRLGLRGPFGVHRDLRPALLGRHQLANAALAVVTLEALREKGIGVTPGAIAEGLRSVRWPGRLEVARRDPTLVLDGAHNVDSARRLREALEDLFPRRRLTLVIGTSLDKDAAGIIAELAPAGQLLIMVRSRHPRSTPADTLLEYCRGQGLAAETAADVASALAQALAKATPEDVICVTGSLFVVAEAREVLGLGHRC